MGFLAHVERTNSVFVLAGGFLIQPVDAAAQIDRVPFDVTIPEPHKFTRAYTCSNCKPVGIDILVKDQLAIVKAGVHIKQNFQSGRL